MNAETVRTDGSLRAYVDGELAGEFYSLDDARTWAKALGIDAELPEPEPELVLGSEPKSEPNQTANLLKGSLIVVAVVCVFTILPNTEPIQSSAPNRASFASASTQWYEGGSLHNASVADGKRATYADKLATAGDWLAATTWDSHLTTRDAFDRLKTKARKLVLAVDGATVDVTPNDLGGVLTAKEVAAAIISTSNDLGPVDPPVKVSVGLAVPYQSTKRVPTSVMEAIEREARLDHPSDPKTQHYVIAKQVEAYLQLANLQSPKIMPDRDFSILRDRTARDHPHDYSTQLFVFRGQLSAYEQLTDMEIPSGMAGSHFYALKTAATRKHHNDYSTQLFLLNRYIEDYLRYRASGNSGDAIVRHLLRYE